MSNAIFPSPSNFPDKGAVSISSYHLRKLRHVRSQDSSLELSHHATRDYGVAMVVVCVCVCIKQEKKCVCTWDGGRKGGTEYVYLF